MTYLGYDKAGLDAQYYMRGRVPEWQEYFDRWEAWSREVRNRRPCRLNLAYGDQAGETVDVFPAAVPPPSPGRLCTCSFMAAIGRR